MNRRIVAAGALLSLIAAAGWLASQVVHPGAVRVGSPLPPIVYHDAAGTHRLAAANGQRTIVMLVAADCEHCAYELETLNRGADRLAASRVYLLSTESNFFAMGDQARYPALAASSAVAWGIVDRADVERTFGVAVIPATFVFDERGRLLQMIRGEVKLDALVASRG